MKLRTSFLTRFLALALALAMIASGANLGLVARVFAATGSEITDGELVAKNYELSDAEKALLESKLLVGDTNLYAAPTADDTEELISVDPDNKTIEAKNYDDDHGNTWLPVAAKVVSPDGEEKVTLTNGKGSFAYEGVAYTVYVTYETSIGVDTNVQTTLLNTAGWLKDGIATINKIAAVSGSLTVLEEAMPALVELANNGYLMSGKPYQFSAEVKATIATLNSQMSANGGKLDLSAMLTEFNKGKVKFLLNRGTEMQKSAEVSLAQFEIVYEPLNFISGMAAMTPGVFDETQISQMTLAVDTIDILRTALESAGKDQWTAAEKGTALVKTGIADVEYAILDTLVAALGATHSAGDFTLAESFAIDPVDLAVNTSMVNVTLKAQVNFFENGVENIEVRSDVVTLAEGTELSVIESNAAAVEDAVKELAAKLGLNLDVHFLRSVDTSVDATLTSGEHYYTITYSPKSYTVTYDYQESEEVAYGAKILLPENEVSGKVYDYFVNGEYVAQGSYVIITGATEVTRTEGKSYVYENLFAVIADNYAPNGDKVAAILKSGALNGDSVIAVRYPDADGGALVTLNEGVLSAKTYESGYNGLIWTPYSYTFDDGEVGYFNGATSVTISKGTYNNISVVYRLTLTNVTAGTVEEKLELAKMLITEGEGQINTLNNLTSAEVLGNMEQLDYTKFSGLNGVINATRFVDTNGDGKVDTKDDRNAPENIAMQNYFSDIVSGIMAKNLDTNDMLKLYNMLSVYVDENNGGLGYYYHNSQAVIDEINSLGTYLNDLLADDEKKNALTIMVNAAGFSGYDDKIATLGDTMATVQSNLKAPNAAINLGSENLDKLIAALNMTGSIETETAGHPYLTSDAFVVAAPNKVSIKVNVQVEGGKAVTYPATYDLGHILTAADVAIIKSEVAKNIASLNIDTDLYTNDYANGAALDAMVGEEMNAAVTLTYTWKMKTYNVEVEGVEGETEITLDKNSVELPAAPEGSGLRYEYVVNGKQVPSGKYNFSTEELKTLFASGKLTINRIVIDEGAEKLDTYVAALNTAAGGTAEKPVVVLENGVITANVDMDGLQGLIMGMAESNYIHIGLDGNAFKYVNDKQATEMSLQVLIDAFLNDEDFGSDTVIAMNGASVQKPAQLLSTTKQLGNNANNAQNVGFVINLTSAPSQVSTVAGLLEKGYVTFNSDAGKLAIELNLPEKVYQVYLTALIATGEVDMDNVAAVNNEIAIQFVWDYVNEIITDDDITTATYTNTLKKLGQNRDLTEYEDIYQKLRSILNDNCEIKVADNMSIVFTDTTYVKTLLDKMMAGKDSLLGMIKEYELDEGETGLTVTATISVNGFNADYEALILDNGDAGVDKFNYTKNLAGEKINGAAVVILLKDTTADLTFPATGILDLNGFALTGDVKSNGNLFIIDSAMDTLNGGSVTGDVSGKVTVIGGTYSDDVTSYLKAGYVQENGAVSNALYTIATDDAGNITFNINADIYKDVADGNIPSVKALGIDIAADLVLNYFTTASLEVGGNKIYGVALDDMIAILEGEGRDGKLDALIEDVLNSVSAPGISGFVNQVIADLLNFQKISETVGTGNPVATYALTTAPWYVDINHVEDEDYLTVGIAAGENAKTVNVNIAIVGENGATNEIKALAGALAEIVTTTDIAVNIEQPTYNAGSNTFDVTGTAKAIVEVDLTKNEHYTTILAVVLANGTGKTSYIDAINAGDMEALKTAVDNTSVADVIASLKALNRNESFADIAEGVTIDIAEAAELESVYHIFLCAAGKVLDHYDVTGGNSKLGALAKEDGWYVLDKDNGVVRTGEPSARGYTVKYNLTLTDLSFSVKVFGEIEPPVVEAAPIVVTDTEGNTVYEGESFVDAIAAVKEGYTVTINEEVTADGGATVVCSFNVVGADKLDMGTNYLTIGNVEYVITSDAENLNVAANVDGYRAAYTDGAYQLVEFAVNANVPTVAACWHLPVVDGETGELTRYMILDLPIDGMALNDLAPNMTVVDMEDKEYAVSIDGYTDGSLIQTGDVMKVTVMEGMKPVAFITYTVIVSGDANANGMIDVGDAVTMQTIYTNNVEGKETEGISFVKMLAADANRNGDIDVGDAVRVQTKWTLMTEADDKDAAWLEWIEMITAVVE